MNNNIFKFVGFCCFVLVAIFWSTQAEPNVSAPVSNIKKFQTQLSGTIHTMFHLLCKGKIPIYTQRNRYQ